MTNYHAANLRIKIAAEASTMATTRFIVGFSRKIIVPATNEVRRVTTATAGKSIEPCDFDDSKNVVNALAVELHSATSRNDRYIIVKLTLKLRSGGLTAPRFFLL